MARTIASPLMNAAIFNQVSAGAVVLAPRLAEVPMAAAALRIASRKRLFVSGLFAAGGSRNCAPEAE